MSNRPLNKSLIEQQESFKKTLLSQRKVLENIADSRPTNPKSHAYGNKSHFFYCNELTCIRPSYSSRRRREDSHQHRNL